MSSQQPNNPLHGVTLERVVTELVDHYGWEGLAQKIAINCFNSNPSVKSSLKFLRKTQWARDKVEALYVDTFSSSTTPTSGKQPKLKKPRASASDTSSELSPWQKAKL